MTIIGIGILFLGLVIGRLVWKRARRKREVVLTVSANRDWSSKAPAHTAILPSGAKAYLDHLETTTTNETLLKAVAEVRAERAVPLAPRTDTVMFHAITPENYPWINA